MTTSMTIALGFGFVLVAIAYALTMTAAANLGRALVDRSPAIWRRLRRR